MRIEDSVFLITGGGSGLGAATARRLSEKGAKVTVLDVNPEAARAVAAEIGGIALACDVTKEEAAGALDQAAAAASCHSFRADSAFPVPEANFTSPTEKDSVPVPPRARTYR